MAILEYLWQWDSVLVTEHSRLRAAAWLSYVGSSCAMLFPLCFFFSFYRLRNKNFKFCAIHSSWPDPSLSCGPDITESETISYPSNLRRRSRPTDQIVPRLWFCWMLPPINVLEIALVLAYFKCETTGHTCHFLFMTMRQ